MDCSDIKGVVNFQVSLHTKECSSLLSQVCFLNFQDQAYILLWYDQTLIPRSVYMWCMVIFSSTQILGILYLIPTCWFSYIGNLVVAVHPVAVGLCLA